MDTDKADHIKHLKAEADREWQKTLSLLEKGLTTKEYLLYSITRCNTIDADWLQSTYKNGKYFLDWKPFTENK